LLLAGLPQILAKRKDWKKAGCSEIVCLSKDMKASERRARQAARKKKKRGKKGEADLHARQVGSVNKRAEEMKASTAPLSAGSRSAGKENKREEEECALDAKKDGRKVENVQHGPAT
jgi:hypothetical protein